MKKSIATRVELRQGLTDDDLDLLRTAFDLFDVDHRGRVDPRELIESMNSVSFDKTNPGVYDIIASLDTPEAAKAGGITFDQLTRTINAKIADKDSKEGMDRIFNLFADENNQDVITLASLKKRADELSEKIPSEELRDLLERTVANGVEITYDEFIDIMTHKAYQ